MKIAILYLGKKGAGAVYTLEMARALYKLNKNICVFLSDSIENKKEFDKEQFEKKYFKTYHSKLSFLFSILTMSGIRRVSNAISQYAPDCLYSTMTGLWDPFIFYKCRKVKTKVKTIHDVEIHDGVKSFYMKFIHKMQFKQAEKYVILSNRFIENLLVKHIERAQICVIPHAGFAYYKNFQQNTNRISENPIVLFFGRIVKYKGLDLLLKSMQKVIQVNPHISLRIAGNGSLDLYKDKINNLKKNVEIFNQWISDEDVPQYFTDVDVVILPYTHATQSGVIPLSYAFSKPVIVTNVGGLSEQVIDNKTGYVIPVNSEVLADKIIIMCENRTMTRQMGQNAYKYMLENLTWESSANKLFTFINDTEFNNLI